MKYQCTVCGQIIDRDDVCPICGSDSSKIISLGEDTQESVTFRCLSCGRVFEDKDVCPYCGGEELYDLTHDNLFNRNKNKPKSSDDIVDVSSSTEDSSSDDFDLLGEFTKAAKGQNDEEEVFEDKEIKLEKEEPEVVDDSTVIKEDPFLNAVIDVEEKKEEPVEEEVIEEEVKVEEPVHEETKHEEEFIEPALEEEIEVDDEFKKDLLSKKEEVNETSLDLKVRRIDLTKDLIIKLFLELEEEENEEKEKFLKEELGILSKLSSEFDLKSVESILKEKNELNEEIFENEKDPFNGYVLYLESTKKDLK